MKKYTVFLSAGEPSGDFLGSQLMKALKSEMGDAVTFTGLGGPLMGAEGLPSLFPIEELSVMGLMEVIPHIWRIRSRIQETVDAIEQVRPNIVVTIDSPGFNFRVGKALKKRCPAIPLVHYTAPSVWAWRPKRAHAVAQFLDHLLVLFPFEPPYFLKEGLATTFVGHPVVELGLENARDLTFRKRHRIEEAALVLTLLPGSRRSEISRLAPVFNETVLKLRRKFPNIHVVIPTLPHLAEQVKEQFTFPVTLVTTSSEKFAAYQESQTALAASGTVSLELAAAGVPMVIAYKINPLTCFLLRRLVRVKYVCLVNLLMEQELVAEKLQEECTPENLATALEGFFKPRKTDDIEAIKIKMQEAVEKLKPPAPYQTPSACAARQIFRMIGVTSP